MTPEQQQDKVAKAKKQLVRELATKIFESNMASVDLDPIAKNEGEVRVIQMELTRKIEAVAHSSISAAVVFYRTWKSRKDAINVEKI